MQDRPFVRPPIVKSLDLEELEPQTLHRRRVVITENASGNETLIPAFVLRSSDPGPVVAVTAAVHGNELNGIPVIHHLIEALDQTKILRGAVIAVPLVNVPGYLRQQREFEDGVDLNRIMPGKADGNESQLYAHRFFERVLSGIDYLIDLHTASFGRVNSLYIRVDRHAEMPLRLARILNPQIIVHSPGSDGTLRAAAAARGVHAITVEIGDPQRHQPRLIRSAHLGIQEILEHLGVVGDISDPDDNEVIECERSYWTHTDRGGLLQVLPDVASYVKEGDVVARLRNIWGDLVREYRAPEDGVVVGKSSNPAARAGSRILHLGIVAR